MPSLNPAANPFALLLDPDRVVQAMERSDRLARLQRRVCHPLDRPLIPHRLAKAAQAYDRYVDAGPDEADAG